MRDLKWFDSLSARDFQNAAVRNEIREVFRCMAPPVKELDGTLAVILYFKTEDDRNDFISAVKQLKPSMVAKAI